MRCGGMNSSTRCAHRRKAERKRLAQKQQDLDAARADGRGRKGAGDRARETERSAEAGRGRRADQVRAGSGRAGCTQLAALAETAAAVRRIGRSTCRRADGISAGGRGRAGGAGALRRAKPRLSRRTGGHPRAHARARAALPGLRRNGTPRRRAGQTPDAAALKRALADSDRAQKAAAECSAQAAGLRGQLEAVRTALAQSCRALTPPLDPDTLADTLPAPARGGRARR